MFLRSLTVGVLLSVWITGSSAHAEPFASALSAIDTFSKSDAAGRAEPIVGVVGFFGQPQPPQWLVLTQIANKPKMMRETVVARGKVPAERRFRRNLSQDLPDIPLKRKSLQLDSQDAFAVVEKLAAKRKVSFDSVHFQLRCRDENEEPVWMLSLNNVAHVSLGVVYVSATSGKVLRTRWVETPVEKFSSPATNLKKP